MTSGGSSADFAVCNNSFDASAVAPCFNSTQPYAAAATAFAGDSVVDVELFYRAGEAVSSYTLRSALKPRLPGQDETANIILDYAAGEARPRVFRVTGLLDQPLRVTRSPWRAWATFGGHGARHILGGADHVLFVVCLVLSAAAVWPLLLRVTGFTIGHSVSLGLGFFGFTPQGAWFAPLVEVLIALSVMYAGGAVLLRRERFIGGALTALLGLLHGLGFAFVLREILHVDAPNLWSSLLAFNLGVELGQLGIALGAAAVLQGLARLSPRLEAAARTAAAAGCVALAAFWFAARLAGLLRAVM